MTHIIVHRSKRIMKGRNEIRKIVKEEGEKSN
jgi:hypothetical protein